MAAGQGGADTAQPGTFASRVELFRSLGENLPPAQTLPVQGALPDWLNGTLLRNGPALFECGKVTLRHWFDGAAMLHRFAFAQGTVAYSGRFLDTHSYRDIIGGRQRRREFATDPCVGLFGRLMSFLLPNPTDNANVHVLPLGNDIVALTESTGPRVIDPQSLATRRPWAIDGQDRLHALLTSAHPVADAAGSWLNYWTRLRRVSCYEVFTLSPATHRRTLLASLPVRHPAYMHSFAATAREVVLSEFPLVVDPLHLLGRRSFIESFRWQPERGTRFHLVPRDGSGAVTTCVGPAMFGFHHIGARTDGDDVLLDLVAYDDPTIIHQFFLRELRNHAAPPLARSEVRRYRLNPKRRQAELVARFAVVLELPTVAGHLPQPYRYVYGSGSPDPSLTDFPHAIARLDIETGDVAWWSSPGCYAGEPVFVPRPGSTREDDGVLLSVVLDAAAGHSFLLVLDATHLTEIARANAPLAIPAGFHGSFLPAEDAAGP